MATYSNIDTTADDAIIPEIWGNLALGHLPAYLNLGRTVAKDTEFHTQNEGDVIHVSKRGALSANQMTENEAVTVQKPSRTDITVTLDNHWEVTFGELDIARALSKGTSMSEYATDAVAVLAEKIENSLAALHPSVTETVSESADAEADLLAVNQKFIENKVPKMLPKYGFISPSEMTRFLKVARATEADKTGSASQSPLRDNQAELFFHGFNLFASQIVKTSGSPATEHNLYYTKNAMVLAMRPLPLPESGTGGTGTIVQDNNGFVMRVVKSWSPTQLANQITTDVLFGVSILDDRLVVELESNATS